MFSTRMTSVAGASGAVALIFAVAVAVVGCEEPQVDAATKERLAMEQRMADRVKAAEQKKQERRAGQPARPARISEAKMMGWVDEGEKQVTAMLKDPDSAKFRGGFFHQAEGLPPVSCGEVNSRNMFGGMTGFQRWVSAGSPETTFIEEQSNEFEDVWQRLCVN